MTTLRARIVGVVVGIPFAAIAWLAASAMFGGSMQIDGRFAALAPLVAVGPAAAPAAAIGVLVASAIVAPRLAQPWADRLMSAVWFVVVGQVAAGVAAALLVLTGPSGSIGGIGDALVRFFATFIAGSWAWALGAGIWVAAAGPVIRRDPPATPEESADSLDRLAQQTRSHTHHDATIVGDQGSRYRQAR
jgi:hypothetical protein